MERTTRQQDHHHHHLHCRGIQFENCFNCYAIIRVFLSLSLSVFCWLCRVECAKPMRRASSESHKAPHTQNEPARFAAALLLSLPPAPVDIFRVKSKQKIMCVSLGGNWKTIIEIWPEREENRRRRRRRRCRSKRAACQSTREYLL